MDTLGLGGEGWSGRKSNFRVGWAGRPQAWEVGEGAWWVTAEGVPEGNEGELKNRGAPDW